MYCLVAIIEYDLNVGMDTYYLLRILSVSLLDKSPIRELLLQAKGKDYEQNDLRSFSKAVNLFITSASGANTYKNIPLGNITSGASFLHKSFVFKK